MATQTPNSNATPFIFLIPTVYLLLLTSALLGASNSEANPTPKAWPEQFHALLVMNFNGTVQINNLWYDWPKGRNFNILQRQLGNVLYDLEWNNGTSFFYTLDSTRECRSAQMGVGILRPNWLDGAEYVGQRTIDGFLCNVWEKADFITYYEDVLTHRPVYWLFYTGALPSIPIYSSSSSSSSSSSFSRSNLITG
ncbi:uncharacterized protein At4g14100-like isoform X2 [Malania oleifera]|uniref:uncharacterized protein At4g14100-like isoform X2 n=1 Tax=Malania oleifera TaxID=397392 RepID=UPI0025AE4595|nr:uncharacterized protein At4g14100-like isoform X2 [Malania oleifera]